MKGYQIVDRMPGFHEVLRYPSQPMSNDSVLLDCGEILFLNPYDRNPTRLYLFDMLSPG